MRPALTLENLRADWARAAALILRHALVLLRDGAGWTQHGAHGYNDSEDCRTYCVGFAISEGKWRPDHVWHARVHGASPVRVGDAIELEARSAVWRALERAGYGELDRIGALARWNDAIERTWPEVRAVLEDAARELEAHAAAREAQDAARRA